MWVIKIVKEGKIFYLNEFTPLRKGVELIIEKEISDAKEFVSEKACDVYRERVNFYYNEYYHNPGEPITITFESKKNEVAKNKSC